jgi:SAM-dependent methyltransferase
MDPDLHRFARSFDTVADAYDRGRPSYPTAAVEWLVGTDQKSVLEVGAGTGKLTEALVALGHDVHATDPSAEMLAKLSENLPDVRTSVATAERLPSLDASVDIVVCAQAFHWFDQEAALAEFARVLRTGGHLALVWNSRDDKIPWVRKLGALIGDQDANVQAPESLVRSTRFGFVDDASYRHWQTVGKEALCDMALSRSSVATLDPKTRERTLAGVRALYDDYGRGPDGMQLPWIARCFRASVIEHPWSVPPREAGLEDASTQDRPESEPPKPDDDGDLLIDFR